jgi:hypothetical protein
MKAGREAGSDHGAVAKQKRSVPHLLGNHVDGLGAELARSMWEAIVPDAI